jgi:predicted nucleic acid-binding protein
VALKDEKYGSACKKILSEIGVVFEGVCSIQVPTEILGSVSRIDSEAAIKALNGFLSLNIKLVPISKEILAEAGKILMETGIDGYDAVHVAVMKHEGITTIITENYKDFRKVKWLSVIRPLDYAAGW